MTRTIDERVVQMAFENSGFEKNVGTSLSTLDRLKRALNFGGAGKGFDELNRSASRVNLNPISEGVNAIANRFNALGIIGIGVLLNLTNSAIEAGKRIASALVIDPIKAGLDEYETKLNSVQTILANTQKEGTNLQTVTAALNELNEYSDKTIYNFQQMARNIGTFTAAGIKLDTSVNAIKGIANLAAISGSNADQASTAMYQLSQALSTGTVRLMDWNSVVNAGMGGQVFQDAIMETARVHGVAIDQIIEEEGSFRDSLQRGWFTSEILTETLSKFTGDLNAEQLRTMGYTEDQIAGIIKMGQTASDAATKVKTFTQLFGTLKEAAQSGWAQTWEILIGDFEEAKVFLTGLNDLFGGMIGEAAKARNELLQGWSDLGGRTQLIEALHNVLNAVLAVIKPITEALRDIFPPVTAQQLFAITEGLTKFTKSLIIGGETAEKIKRIFKGIFAIFDIVKMAVVAVGKEFFRLLSYLAPVPGGFAEIIAKVGDFILKIRDAIKANDTFGKIMRAIGDTILLIAGVIGSGISAFVRSVDKFKELNKSEGFLKSFSGAISEFFNFFKTLDFDILNDFVERIAVRFAPLSKLGDLLRNAFSGAEEATNPFREKLLKIASNIREALGKFVLTILDKLSKIDFSNFNFNNVFDSLNAGLLGALLISIIRFVSKGTGIFGSIVDIFKSVSGFAENANGILAGLTSVLTGVKDIFTAWQQQIRAGILLKIAGAIAILAISLIALSLVDSEKLTTALAAITLLFANLLGSIATYEKLSGGVAGIPAMAKAIGAMIGISVAVLILSGALVKLGEIPAGDIIKGVLAIGALTVLLVATAKALTGQEAAVIRGVGSMILFSIALRALVGPLKSLAEMNFGEMIQGLVGLGVLLAEIAIFMKAMNFKAADLDDVFGLLVLSGAISMLSGVIEQLGSLDASTLTQGLAVLGILLTGLAAFTKAASGGGLFLLTSAGILVLAGAMVILADVLKTIGSMSIDQVTVALIGLGGALLILGVAMNAMNAAVVGAAALLIAAAALAVLVPPLKALGSMSIEQVGIALLALAGVFTILGIAGAVLTPVVPTLIGLAFAVAALGVGALAAGVGVLAFATGLATLVAIGAAGGTALAGILLAIATVLPTLAAAAGLAIIAFAKIITEGAPVVFTAWKTLMLGFIKATTEMWPQIIDMLMTGISEVLKTFVERTPEFVQAGYDILIGFLKGVRDNIGQVVTVSYDIITAYLAGVSSRLPELISSGYNLVISFIDGLAAAAEENIPRLMASVQNLGLAIIKGVVKGIVSGHGTILQGIRELGRIIINQFKKDMGIASPSSVFMAMALDIIRGLVNGIRNSIGLVVTQVISLGKRIVDSFKTNVSSFYNIGRDFVVGLANGIKDYINVAINSAIKLAQSVLSTVTGIFDANSPSRKMFDLGEDIDRGLANGITKFASTVLSATKQLGSETIDGFSSIIASITDAVNSDLEASPTIRPVLDLSAIAAGGTQIDSLLGGRKLNVALASIKAANVSSIGQTVADAQTQQQTGATPSVSFTQNNYSPKALSRIEIYRETRNQLLQVKELVGA